MGRDLDTALLRAFLACARSGSITRAARSLDRSQPTISEQMRRLEDIFGAKLLVRGSRGVELTPTGETLIPFADAMTKLTDDTWRALGLDRENDDGFGIGILEDLWDAELAALLSRLGADHRTRKIELVSLAGPRLLTELRHGRVQLVLGDPSGIDLPIERAWRVPFQWTMSPAFEPDVRPLPVVLCSKPCRWRTKILSTLDDAGIAWRIVFESTNFVGVLAAVRSEMGVAALLPGDLGADLQRVAPATMPLLPSAEIALQRGPEAKGELVDKAIEMLTGLMNLRFGLAIDGRIPSRPGSPARSK